MKILAELSTSVSYLKSSETQLLRKHDDNTSVNLYHQSTYVKSDRAQVSLTYNKKGVLENLSNNEKVDQKQIHLRREAALLQIQKQLMAFLNIAGTVYEEVNSEQSSDPLDLIKYFEDNPDDLAKIQSGEIPEYFGKEQAGQRILDIWLIPDSDGNVDIDNARENINKAYSEILEMFGGKLPKLVLETQKYIMQKLDEYKK